MEAIYYSNITGSIILVTLFEENILIKSGPIWGNSTVNIEKANKYLINSCYELIGYV